jgi:hypothetical protein
MHSFKLVLLKFKLNCWFVLFKENKVQNIYIYKNNEYKDFDKELNFKNIKF